MLHKTITIRTVGKWNVHHYGVLHCLLQPISDSMLVIFRLNDCNRSAFRSNKEYSLLSWLPLRETIFPLKLICPSVILSPL